MPSLDTYSKLLLHCNGINGNTPKQIYISGDTQISTSQSKFGGSSILFDGTGDSLNTANSSDYNFSTGEFCVDFWVRFNSLPSASSRKYIFTQENYGLGNILTFEIYNNAGTYEWRFASYIGWGSAITVNKSTTLSTDVWYHVALIRTGNDFKIFQDGSQCGTTVTSSNATPNAGVNLYIGAGMMGGYLNGYLDEFRISKGTSRWTTTFTAPAVPHISDSYTGLLLHGNGTNTSTIIIDACGNDETGKSITYTGAVLDTAQSKFGGSSLLLTPGNYVSFADSDDWFFDVGDFTIDFWVQFNTLPTLGNHSTCYYNGLSSNISISLVNTGGTYSWKFNVYVPYSDIITSNQTTTVSANVWYHVAVVRNGNNFFIFQDGVQIGSTVVNSSSVPNITGELYIGGVDYTMDGWLDEFRISKGIARWITTFTPPTAEYLLLMPDPEVTVDNTIYLTDSWDISRSGYVDINESILINDSWTIENNIVTEDISESLFITDSWTTDLAGILKIRYATKLYTGILGIVKLFTSLRVGLLLENIYNTKLYLQALSTIKIKTDLRLKKDTYTQIQLGSLSSYDVKLDGVSLTDVDYSSLSITFNLNNNPSKADFILARHHDNLDETLDAVASEITDENKIQIYDGTRLLFTGYITQIDAVSSSDTVRITAEDVRYKFARNSFELEYGAEYKIDSNSNGIADEIDTDKTVINAPSYIKFEKSIALAYAEIISEIGVLISGADTLPFVGTFVPEYTKSYNDYGSLLDEIILNTANANWYVDENEYLKFQVVGQGQLKLLNLSSLTEQRHPYDLILNDIQLNKKPSNYVKTLNVKRGKDITRKWQREEFNGWVNAIPEFLKNIKEKTLFCFQQWGEQDNTRKYVGINQDVPGYFTPDGWVLKPILTAQWQSTDTEYDLPDISVGTGEPKRTVYFTSYGKQTTNIKWEERMKVSGSNNTIEEPYLVEVKEEEYDRTAFLLEAANFQLSQSNKLLTTANTSILLDAFEYYNIQFSDLINIGNTIKANIYNNTNGFPLNINSITINFSKRIVTLNLTNYGKSTYTKVSNILTNYVPPSVNYLMKRYALQQYIPDPSS